jgi:hypothetical protein
VDVSRPVLLAAALVLAVAVGPWLAVVAARLTTRDDAAHSGPARVVVLTGVFLGLLVGALVSVVLLVTRRAGWRSALPFGPPLLTGAVLALALSGSV